MKSESFSKKEFNASGFCLLCHLSFSQKNSLKMLIYFNFLGFGFNQILSQFSVLMDIKAHPVHWCEKMKTNLSHPKTYYHSIHSLGCFVLWLQNANLQYLLPNLSDLKAKEMTFLKNWQNGKANFFASITLLTSYFLRMVMCLLHSDVSSD